MLADKSNGVSTSGAAGRAINCVRFGKRSLGERKKGMEKGGQLILAKLNIRNLLTLCDSHAHHHRSGI